MMIKQILNKVQDERQDRVENMQTDNNTEGL